MHNLKQYTDIYPVHDDLCEEILGTLVGEKTKVYVSKELHRRCRLNIRLQHRRAAKMLEHVRRTALRRHGCVRHELASGLGTHLHLSTRERFFFLFFFFSDDVLTLIDTSISCSDRTSFVRSTPRTLFLNGRSVGETSIATSTRSTRTLRTLSCPAFWRRSL